MVCEIQIPLRSLADELQARWACNHVPNISGAVGPGWVNEWPFGPKKAAPTVLSRMNRFVVVEDRQRDDRAGGEVD